MANDKIVNLYNDLNVSLDYCNVNKFMRAVIINFHDGRGDIIVENDNFGTDELFPDFTEGRKKAGLHPLQIVFSGVKFAKMFHERYIDQDGVERTF